VDPSPLTMPDESRGKRSFRAHSSAPVTGRTWERKRGTGMAGGDGAL
jgi:hypothetical protein